VPSRTRRIVSKIKSLNQIIFEDDCMRFIALSFFFLCAKCCPFLYRHVEVTANDKVGRFLGHGVCMHVCMYVSL